MSSIRKPAQPTKPGGPRKPAERQPPKPIFTPTNVLIVFAVIIVVSLITYWKAVYAAKTAEVASVQSSIQQQVRQNEIYKKKAGMLAEAIKVNEVIDDKLETDRKYFIQGQEGLIDFFDNWFLYMFLTYWEIDSASVDLKPEQVFKVSWKMKPVQTLPKMEATDWLWPFFKWEYIGEGTGTGEVSAAGANFLEPLTITLDLVNVSYDRLRKIIEALQTDKTFLVTVHAFKNNGDLDFQRYRPRGTYSLAFSVYIMNPEGVASGDVPAGMPKDESL